MLLQNCEAKMDQPTITRSSTTEDVYRYLKTWRRGLKPEELNEFASVDGGDLLDTPQMMLESILGRIRGGLLWQDLHSPTPGTVFPKKFLVLGPFRLSSVLKLIFLMLSLFPCP